MSLTTESHAAQFVDLLAPASPLSESDAARITAAWAGSGEFGDHVVYERDRRWTFAAGVRARVVITRSEVIVDDQGDRTTTPWHGDPADALAAATASLSIPDWRVYGWVGFDFCAPYHGILERVPEDTVLAHLIVPEFDIIGFVCRSQAPVGKRIFRIQGYGLVKHSRCWNKPFMRMCKCIL